MSMVKELEPAPVPAPGVSPGTRRAAGWASRPFVVTPPRVGVRPLALRTWRYRHIAEFIGLGYMQKRYARTWLGLIWLPLRPGWQLITKILVFGGLIGISAGKTPYPIFFIVANAAWQLFYECAFWSTRSIELNRKLVTTLEIPRLVFILSALVPAFVDFLVNLSFAGLAVLWYVVRAPHTFYLDFTLRTLVLVPSGLVLMILIGLAVGLFTSGASARARDIRFSIGYIMGFLQLLTPIIYPLSRVPPRYRPLAELNPLTGATEMVKDGLFGVHELSSDAIYITLAWVVVLWVVGVWLHNRREVGVLLGRRVPLLPRLRHGAVAAEEAAS